MTAPRNRRQWTGARRGEDRSCLSFVSSDSTPLPAAAATTTVTRQVRVAFGRAADAEDHRRRGERQAVTAGDTAGRARRARQIISDAEAGREHATREIADGEERDEHAAAAARGDGGGGRRRAQQADRQQHQRRRGDRLGPRMAPPPGPTPADGDAMRARISAIAIVAAPPTTSRTTGEAFHFLA